MDQEANTEQDFHFKVPTAEDEDDMDDLSSDEGEVEEFIKDYHIELLSPFFYIWKQLKNILTEELHLILQTVKLCVFPGLVHCQL